MDNGVIHFLMVVLPILAALLFHADGPSWEGQIPSNTINFSKVQDMHEA